MSHILYMTININFLIPTILRLLYKSLLYFHSKSNSQKCQLPLSILSRSLSLDKAQRNLLNNQMLYYHYHNIHSYHYLLLHKKHVLYFHYKTYKGNFLLFQRILYVPFITLHIYILQICFLSHPL